MRPLGNEEARYSSGEHATVAMIGRICKQKDPEYFVELILRLRDMGYRGRAVWIGDGDAPTRARMEASGVVVTGWLAGADLRSLLETVTVYVHTARYEGFPLSVLDAASFGIPVLARSIACFADTSISAYDTVAGHARGVHSALECQDRWNQEQDKSKALTAVMSEDAQRAALTTLYGFSEKTVRAQ
jgi:glycosyltransferase involved in cell wall biosynthesis